MSRGQLWKYLESACYVRDWEPGKYFIGFNFTSTGSDSDNVILGNITNNLDFPNRLSTFASHKRKVLPYDDNFHSHRVVYFPGDYRQSHRILTHFYTYLYFNDPSQERIYKRLVRDRLHYHDDIFCVAGLIVHMIHALASKLSNGKYQMPNLSRGHPLTQGGNVHFDATYHAYHIRRYVIYYLVFIYSLMMLLTRGDFQYHHTRMSAEQIWSNTKHLLNANRTKVLYISTDEKNLSFFQPFRQQFHVVFLKDFIHKILHDKFNRNHIGMIEQVICANAHTFIGTPLSTFTGYITRMRGECTRIFI